MLLKLFWLQEAAKVKEGQLPVLPSLTESAFTQSGISCQALRTPCLLAS